MSDLPSAEPLPRRGVVAVIPQNGRVLAIRRSRLVVAPLAWCFPGGAIEGGESDEEALVRELDEELHCGVCPRRAIWRSVTPWNVALTWWLADIRRGSPRPNPAEVDSIAWVTLDELAALEGLLESNAAFIAAVRRGDVQID